MNESSLRERQTWFRYFPEGSIEFVMITRVLGLLLILALAAVRGSQTLAVLIALGGVIWLDYALTLWWLIQLATDLKDVIGGAVADTRAVRFKRMRMLGISLLPATVVILLVTPWPRLFFGPAAGRLMWFIAPTLITLLIVTIVLAYLAVRKLSLINNPLGQIVLLIPVVHWLALHRVLVRVNQQIGERLGQQKTESQSNLRLLAGIADAFWIVAILPWVLVLIITLLKGEPPQSRLIPVCGSLLASVFVVLDIAAMENLQQRFIKLLRQT